MIILHKMIRGWFWFWGAWNYRFKVSHI